MLLPLEPLVDVALDPVVDVPVEPITQRQYRGVAYWCDVR